MAIAAESFAGGMGISVALEAIIRFILVPGTVGVQHSAHSMNPRVGSFDTVGIQVTAAFGAGQVGASEHIVARRAVLDICAGRLAVVGLLPCWGQMVRRLRSQ